jgi:hypothetical protein
MVASEILRLCMVLFQLIARALQLALGNAGTFVWDLRYEHLHCMREQSGPTWLSGKSDVACARNVAALQQAPRNRAYWRYSRVSGTETSHASARGT